MTSSKNAKTMWVHLKKIKTKSHGCVRIPMSGSGIFTLPSCLHLLGAALVPHLTYSPARLYLRPAQLSILWPVRQLPHGGNQASLFLVFVFMLCNFLVSPISMSSHRFPLLQLNYLDTGFLEESPHLTLVPWYSQFLRTFHSELQPGSRTTNSPHLHQDNICLAPQT